LFYSRLPRQNREAQEAAAIEPLFLWILLAAFPRRAWEREKYLAFGWEYPIKTTVAIATSLFVF
jgi:hypothetical protein